MCGPSIDIARDIEDVLIEAITLSHVQARIARRLVRQAQVSNAVEYVVESSLVNDEAVEVGCVASDYARYFTEIREQDSFLYMVASDEL